MEAGLDGKRIAEVIVTSASGAELRGSGYRVSDKVVLTSAHVVSGATSALVRLDSGRPEAWSVPASIAWIDDDTDVAALLIRPPESQARVQTAQFGSVGDRNAVIAVTTAGYPRWKIRRAADGRQFRDLHQADGTIAVLSNRRGQTLEITVAAPSNGGGPSPWEAMSGAAVWAGTHIIGVVAQHHRAEGAGRLTAVRIDTCLARVSTAKRRDLCDLLEISDPSALVDVVSDSTRTLTRIGYVQQVHDVAPAAGLVGRAAELDELVAFCAGSEAYVWWQAGPWAGKSALMATFVLHPPVGVDVVSFFVTGRLASQSDSDAFTEALIDQLRVLLDEPRSLDLAPTARDPYRRALMDRVVAKLAREGRRLVLVVDGLDEDTGTLPGARRASIASLLPKQPSDALRIVLAGRPHPPIPDDVPEGHPVRTCRVRYLEPSAQAKALERDATRELQRILASNETHRAILGSIVASGGGVTRADLARLTEQPPYELDTAIGGAFGRTMSLRDAPGGPVFLFAHDTLRESAEQQLGPALVDKFRDRIDVWSQEYESRGWPTDTPRYLLQGYPQMLAATADLPRLTQLATDPQRHRRLLETIGGDGAALAEIRSAQTLALAQSDPSMVAMCRLAFWRDRLIRRNASLPEDLPAVWALLGAFDRAEAMARSIVNPARQSEALTGVAEVAAAAGALDVAASVAMSIPSSDRRAFALVTIVEAAIAQGRVERAMQAANAIPDAVRRAWAQASIVESACAAGDRNLAAAAARSLCETSAEPGATAAVVAAVNSAVAALARVGWSNAVDASSYATNGACLAAITEATALTGDPHTAATFAAMIDDPSERVWSHTFVAIRAAADKDYDLAIAIAHQIPNRSLQQFLVTILRSLGLAFEFETQSEPAATRTTNGDDIQPGRSGRWRGSAAPALIGPQTMLLAHKLMLRGDLDAAGRLVSGDLDEIAAYEGPDTVRDTIVVSKVAALKRVGLFEWAAAAAMFISDDQIRSLTLGELARSAASLGFTNRALSIAASMADGDQRAFLMAASASASPASSDSGDGHLMSAGPAVGDHPDTFFSRQVDVAVIGRALLDGEFEHAAAEAAAIVDQRDRSALMATVVSAWARSLGKPALVRHSAVFLQIAQTLSRPDAIEAAKVVVATLINFGAFDEAIRFLDLSADASDLYVRAAMHIRDWTRAYQALQHVARGWPRDELFIECVRGMISDGDVELASECARVAASHAALLSIIVRDLARRSMSAAVDLADSLVHQDTHSALLAELLATALEDDDESGANTVADRVRDRATQAVFRTRMARHWAEAGRVELAKRDAMAAAQLAHDAPAPEPQAELLPDLILSLAVAGSHHRSVELTALVPHPDARAAALSRAITLAGIGTGTRAPGLHSAAAGVASTLPPGPPLDRLVSTLLESAARSGDEDVLHLLLVEPRRVAVNWSDVRSLVRMAIGVGHLEFAAKIAHALPQSAKSDAFETCAIGAIAAGDFRQARLHAEQVTDADTRAALTARIEMKTGDHKAALKLVRSIRSEAVRRDLVGVLAASLAHAGNDRSAATLVGSIPDVGNRYVAFSVAAEAAVAGGHLEMANGFARRAAHGIDDLGPGATNLVAINAYVRALAILGDRSGVHRMVEGLTDPTTREMAITYAAVAWANLGHDLEAISWAFSIASNDLAGRALSKVFSIIFSQSGSSDRGGRAVAAASSFRVRPTGQRRDGVFEAFIEDAVSRKGWTIGVVFVKALIDEIRTGDGELADGLTKYFNDVASRLLASDPTVGVRVIFEFYRLGERGDVSPQASRGHERVAALIATCRRSDRPTALLAYAAYAEVLGDGMVAKRLVASILSGDDWSVCIESLGIVDPHAAEVMADLIVHARDQ